MLLDSGKLMTKVEEKIGIFSRYYQELYKSERGGREKLVAFLEERSRVF